jgi:hypothetical protein
MLARVTGAGESASNEGDTQTGVAMTSGRGPRLADNLTHWQTLTSRPDDAQTEFGGL